MTNTRMPRCAAHGRAIRVAFDRVLGRGIERPVRHRQEAKHGADVDDAASALTSHVGHDGTRHPDDAKEIRIEDRPGLCDRALFRCRRCDPEARVIHQEIDPAFRSQNFPDGGCDGFFAGHVEGQHLERSLARLRCASAGAVDFVARHGQTLAPWLRRFRRGARNERDLSLSLVTCVSMASVPASGERPL